MLINEKHDKVFSQLSIEKLIMTTDYGIIAYYENLLNLLHFHSLSSIYITFSISEYYLILIFIIGYISGVILKCMWVEDWKRGRRELFHNLQQ